jgi:hypothetical protein
MTAVLLACVGLLAAGPVLYLAAIGLTELWNLNLTLIHRACVEEHRAVYAECVTLTQQMRHYERLLREMDDPAIGAKF